MRGDVVGRLLAGIGDDDEMIGADPQPVLISRVVSATVGPSSGRGNRSEPHHEYDADSKSVEFVRGEHREAVYWPMLAQGM
jgi:hypothetical protein